MAQEENSQKCSNSSSGGGGSGGGGVVVGGGNQTSKKLKRKKVPQRGLGVAQLEKIRLEEQQKRDANLQGASILLPNSITSPSNSSSCLAIQCTNIRYNLSPSSIPPPPSSPTDLLPPNSVIRPASSNPTLGIFHPNSTPFSKPLNVDGGEIGWSTILGPEHSNWPKLWNGDYNLEGENQRLDHNGVTFRSDVNFPYESNPPSWPLPNMMQTSQQFQVNVSSGTSSSSVMNFQMEPPSNQSYYVNNNTPFWMEKEKMVGMKRAYPFSVDHPPGPSFRCKFPPTYIPPISRLDDSASCNTEGTINVEHEGNPNFREGPSSSSGMFETNSKKFMKANGDLNAEFLTLAPPATASSPHLSSKNKHSSSYLPYQDSIEEQIHRSGPSGTNQQSFFSFFPSAMAQIGQAGTAISNNNGELGASVSEKVEIGEADNGISNCNGEGEIVDLNLKL